MTEEFSGPNQSEIYRDIQEVLGKLKNQEQDQKVPWHDAITALTHVGATFLTDSGGTKGVAMVPNESTSSIDILHVKKIVEEEEEFIEVESMRAHKITDTTERKVRQILEKVCSDTNHSGSDDEKSAENLGYIG